MMKTKNILAVLCLLSLFSVSAMADSISPATYSATVGLGESVTITKTVTVDDEPTAKVDVYFLADETGSMGGAIANVKAAATSILSSTASLGDVAFGVGGYRDIYDTWDYGAYAMHQDLTTNQATAQAGINSWSAAGGGDTPEGQMIALTELSTGVSWRTGSERILVWFGDAPGHDPRDGYTEAGATTALTTAGIQVEAISVGYDQLNSTGQAARIASATGGTFHPTVAVADIVTTITDAIGSAISTYTSVGIDTTEVPTGVTVTVVPPSYSGSFDRSSTETFDFAVTFTGDAIGDYSFSLYGLVDGGRIATEADSITVVPVPGALLLGMLGLSVAGVRLRKHA